jgi:hypothetical protein
MLNKAKQFTQDLAMSRSQNQLLTRISKLACGLCACFITVSSTLLSATIPPNDAIKMDSLGNMVAVWQDSDNGSKVIYASQFTMGASAWTAPQRLSVGGDYCDQPRLAVNSSGQAVAIWKSMGAMPPFTVYAATIALQGSSTWTSAKAISSPGNCVVADYYSLQVNDNNHALITWQIMTAHGIDTYSSTSTLSDGANSWSAPLLIGGG